jgi:hypothetical protein
MGMGKTCPSRDTHENPNDWDKNSLYQHDKRQAIQVEKMALSNASGQTISTTPW